MSLGSFHHCLKQVCVTELRRVSVRNLFFHRGTLHVHILNRLIINVHDLQPLCKPYIYIYIIFIFDEPNVHLHKTHRFLLDLTIFQKMFLSASPVRQIGVPASVPQPSSLSVFVVVVRAQPLASSLLEFSELQERHGVCGNHGSLL